MYHNLKLGWCRNWNRWRKKQIHGICIHQPIIPFNPESSLLCPSIFCAYSFGDRRLVHLPDPGKPGLLDCTWANCLLDEEFSSKQSYSGYRRVCFYFKSYCNSSLARNHEVFNPWHAFVTKWMLYCLTAMIIVFKKLLNFQQISGHLWLKKESSNHKRQDHESGKARLSKVSKFKQISLQEGQMKRHSVRQE